jgi:hypothetical protein
MTDDTRARARALVVPYGADFVCPLHDTHHDYCDHCVQAKHLVEFAEAIEQPLRDQITALEQERDRAHLSVIYAEREMDAARVALRLAQARVQELEQACRFVIENSGDPVMERVCQSALEPQP